MKCWHVWPASVRTARHDIHNFTCNAHISAHSNMITFMLSIGLVCTRSRRTDTEQTCRQPHACFQGLLSITNSPRAREANAFQAVNPVALGSCRVKEPRPVSLPAMTTPCICPLHILSFVPFPSLQPYQSFVSLRPEREREKNYPLLARNAERLIYGRPTSAWWHYVGAAGPFCVGGGAMLAKQAGMHIRHAVQARAVINSDQNQPCKPNTVAGSSCRTKGQSKTQQTKNEITAAQSRMLILTHLVGT